MSNRHQEHENVHWLQFPLRERYSEEDLVITIRILTTIRITFNKAFLKWERAKYILFTVVNLGRNRIQEQNGPADQGILASCLAKQCDRKIWSTRFLRAGLHRALSWVQCTNFSCLYRVMSYFVFIPWEIFRAQSQFSTFLLTRGKTETKVL